MIPYILGPRNFNEQQYTKLYFLRIWPFILGQKLEKASSNEITIKIACLEVNFQK